MYEAFLSPRVLRRYAEYMHAHRKQKDGTLRPGDNWQKGIPLDAYMDSLVRHVFDAWHEYREQDGEHDMQELMCAIMFNAMGILYEHLK